MTGSKEKLEDVKVTGDFPFTMRQNTVSRISGPGSARVHARWGFSQNLKYKFREEEEAGRPDECLERKKQPLSALGIEKFCS